jgi:hypothetical protein
MSLQIQLCATLHATPEDLVGWLHTVTKRFSTELTWPAVLVVGPHTARAILGDAAGANHLTPFETLALYVVDESMAHDIAVRQVALALTYLPLSQPGIGLDLRVWPPFPAALATLKVHLSDYFTQASLVLTSAAALHSISDLNTLACNRWLLEQFADPAFAERKAAKQLYSAWLEQYRALKGSYPADPRRSFRALLATYQRRVASGSKSSLDLSHSD